MPKVRMSPGLFGLLQDHERMLESLLTNIESMDYCCLLDQHWTMVFISQGCMRLTGYEPSDLLNNNRISYEFITQEEDRAEVRKKLVRKLGKDDPMMWNTALCARMAT